MPRLSLRTVLALALATGACSDAGGGGAGTPPPTEILVDPTEFVGSVPCVSAPGGLQSYVVTLVDVTEIPRARGPDGGPATGDAAAEPETPGVVLPSSRPTPCNLGVVFDRVYGGDGFTEGNAYVADIQGYDRPASELSHALGSAVMLDAAGNFVPPRWATSCGRREANLDALGSPPFTATDAGSPLTDAGSSRDGGASLAVRAKYRQTVRMRPCLPFVEIDPPATSVTALTVTPSRALPGLGCEPADCAIARYTVTVRETGEILEGACDETIVVAGLDAGTGYYLDVDAYAPGDDEPGWRATCYRVALPGVTLEAACDPVVSRSPDASPSATADGGTCP